MIALVKVATLANLSGPNNPQTNFFASQINNENGVLDTSGTFGTRNANAAAGPNTSACRQGWDITAVDVSDKLAASQSSAVIRFTSDGDLYVPNALALQIDSKGANIDIVKSADKTFADIGEEITYTLALTRPRRLAAAAVAAATAAIVAATAIATATATSTATAVVTAAATAIAITHRSSLSRTDRTKAVGLHIFIKLSRRARSAVRADRFVVGVDLRDVSEIHRAFGGALCQPRIVARRQRL